MEVCNIYNCLLLTGTSQGGYYKNKQTNSFSSFCGRGTRGEFGIFCLFGFSLCSCLCCPSVLGLVFYEKDPLNGIGQEAKRFWSNPICGLRFV